MTHRYSRARPAASQLVSLWSTLGLCAALAAGCTDDVGPRPDAGDAEVRDTGDAPDTDTGPGDTALPAGLTLLSVEPKEGRTTGLEEVYLTGGELGGVVQVLFGDAPALDPFAVNDGLVVALTPPHARGLVDVTVIDDRGRRATLPLAFEYSEPVAVTLVEPRAGDRLGGERVTVFGAGFTPDAVVLIGGRAAIGTRFIDEGRLEATTPEGAAGVVDVHVSCDGGVGKLRRGYEYLATTLPVAGGVRIDRVVPASGPAAGGTSVVIEGSGFPAGAAVRIGALPAASVTVESAQRIRAKTAPGSPGPATVRLIASGTMAEKAGAYEYEGAPAIWAVDPPQGSVAGGTRVVVRGAGFPTSGEVALWFGGNAARDVEVRSSTEIVAVTPAGPVGLAPVAVKAAGLPDGELRHPTGFVYFDPATNPGTWGEPIDGALNVTVQDARSGARLVGAFVMVGASTATRHRGYTDANGQITFSGEDLLGEQTVTASFNGYQVFQLAGFDAENATLPLERVPTCSDLDDMPCDQVVEPPPIAFVRATIVGKNKGPTTPFGECRDWPEAPNGLCRPCASDVDCGGVGVGGGGLGEGGDGVGQGVCRELGSEGAFCASACVLDTDCSAGFKCLDPTGTDKERRCVPPPGTPVAYCDITEPDLFSDDSITYPGVPVGANDLVQLPAHLGDFAVFCWAGLDVKGDFRPQYLGVTRNLGAFQNGEVVETEVRLDIPLTQRVTLEVDRPTFGTINQEMTSLRVGLNLNGDGVLEFPPRRAFTARSFVLQIPAALTGEIYDARWDVYVEVSVPPLNGGSAAFEQGLERLGSDLDYRWSEGAWAPMTSPPQTTRGVAAWRNADGTEVVVAVGEKGRVLKRFGETWATMPSEGNRELMAVAVAPSEGMTERAIAVGIGGLALHWSGLRWEPVPTGTTSTMEAVAFADAQVAYAVAGREVLRWDGASWAMVHRGATPLHGVWAASADEVWAVGDDGVVVRGSGGLWEEAATGVGGALRAVRGGAAGLFAVGDGGAVLRWDGAAWVDESVGEADLHALWVDDAVVAVGARATILERVDGVWVGGSQEASTGTLRAVVEAGAERYAMGSGELVIGPLLGIPEALSPTPGDFLGDRVSWTARPGREAHFSVVEFGGEVGPCSACGFLFMIPYTEWRGVLDGDLFEARFPDLRGIPGASWLGSGFKGMTLYRVRTDDSFDFDHTATSGFYGGLWRAWAWRSEAYIR